MINEKVRPKISFPLKRPQLVLFVFIFQSTNTLEQLFAFIYRKLCPKNSKKTFTIFGIEFIIISLKNFNFESFFGVR